MRADPCTAEYIEAIAVQEPDLPALYEDGHWLRYGQLAGMLRRCAQELQRLGVRRGERVAVSGPGVGMELVLLLTAEGLGAVTASFLAQGDQDAGAVIGRADRVFSCLPQAVPHGAAFHRIDDAFAQSLARPAQGPVPAWVPPAPHEPQRILRTSGPAGEARFMLLGRGGQEWWIRSAIDSWGWNADRGSRLLVLSPWVVHGGFMRACACLRRGGAVVAGGGADFAHMAPTHVMGMPLQMERLLAELPAGYSAPQPVVLSTFGGAPSPALRERLQTVFRGPLYNRYGMNEAGIVCEQLDAGGTGLIAPGRDVRILDDTGADVPAGEEGVIAVRTPATVAGYLDQPEASAAAFRDGWFVSGDVGALVGPRTLRLGGRHDDLVRVGGLKVPAAQLQAELAKLPALADGAVLSVHLAAGRLSVGVAAVLAPGFSRQQAAAQVEAVLPSSPGGGVGVLFVQALPRLPSGKLDRMALLRAFGQQFTA